MAGSRVRGESAEAADKRIQGDAETPAAEENAKAADTDRAARRLPAGPVSVSERDRMVVEARAVRFPVAWRGYEQAAVDRYVEQVNRLIAELEISSSPESAVRHALHEVSEETRELLQRAHQTGDEITARSRAKADERLQQAEREAAELREAAGHEVKRSRAEAQREANELRASTRREVDEMVAAAEERTRELERNAETLWHERRRLVEDMRALGEQLVAIGEAEAKRFPRTAEPTPAVDEGASTAVIAPVDAPEKAART